MSQYAKNTRVAESQTRADIERTLERYGASGFGYVTQAQRAAIEFIIKERRIRFVIHLPSEGDDDIRYTPSGYVRATSAAQQELGRARRQRWRALLLFVKASLEAVESGVISLDEAFLPHFVLPDGHTVVEHALPVIEQAYKSGKVLALLPEAT